MNRTLSNYPPEVYHASPEWCHSKLKYLPGNPEMFWAKFIADPKPKWAQRPQVWSRNVQLGSLFHGMLLEGLEPDVVPSEILASNGAMTTNAAKAFAKDHPNWIKQDEYEDLCYAIDRCRMDDEIAAYLETKGEAELSLFWDDEQSGLQCRGRLDRLCEFSDGLHILDVKFSGGCDERWVSKQLLAMNYYRQAAFYMTGVEKCIAKPKAFTFLFVRSVAPFDAALWQMNENDLDMGARHNRVAMDDLVDRITRNHWHGPNFNQINQIALPNWAYEQDALYATDGEEFPESEFSDFAEFNQAKGE